MAEQLEIVSREEVASGVVALGFHIPANMSEAYRHVPGQFIMVRTRWQGEDITRSYSIVSGSHDDRLQIAVKRVEGGLVSNHLCDTVEIGDRLTVSTPRGLFRNHGGRHHVYFAAGSGITPVFCMINAILAAGTDETVTLFYGNKESADIIFLEALQSLKDKYMQRFTAVFLLSRQKRDLRHLNGRLDGRKIKTFFRLGLIPHGADVRYYICGPGAMSDNISRALVKQGVTEAAIFSEQFIAQRRPAHMADEKPRPKKPRKGKKGVKVAVSLNGVTEDITLTDSQPNLLDAARAGGTNLPFSCRGGMCGTCRCRIIRGAVDMATNYALEDWELAQGFVLACQINTASIKKRAGKLAIEFDTE